MNPRGNSIKRPDHLDEWPECQDWDGQHWVRTHGLGERNDGVE